MTIKKKVGIIINPFAGMGGSVGLKGSDGLEILKIAIERGAQSKAPARATEALKILAKIEDQIEVFTYPDDMGENEARNAGLEPIVIGCIHSTNTTAEDTVRAAQEMVDRDVDLIIFAGGDGTARDIYRAISDKKIPVIGIPAGVKMHSAVYAVNPRSAGEAATKYLEGNGFKIRDAEVMDIDEELFRQERVTAKLYGYLLTPELKEYMQSVKSGSRSEEASLLGIATEIIENMEDDVFYIIGPGTTTRSIMTQLNLKNTLLGVDVILNKEVIANDVTESQLYELLESRSARIVVTVIGGQGHVFGRGNQQLSPRILRKVGKENIQVIASQDKLIALESSPLRVDTGDSELDCELSGIIKVVTGYKERTMYKITN